MKTTASPNKTRKPSYAPVRPKTLLLALLIAISSSGALLYGCTQSTQTIVDGTSNANESVPTAETARAKLDLTVDYREDFLHGVKTADSQKYIVLHDTETDADAEDVIDYWDDNGSGVAAHFVINKDGSVVQCVPMDQIAYHAGHGDNGNSALYGVCETERDLDDEEDAAPVDPQATDVGMNDWSIGIEMVHVGGEGGYPEAQLAAMDNLIAYIDAYYGFESTIIDHKAWRSSNSDTSVEFSAYLANYQDHRTHV